VDEEADDEHCVCDKNHGKPVQRAYNEHEDAPPACRHEGGTRCQAL
jgi:hypothetical protein